jgi:YbgC/YbaW family acyl-CoA thioester hydrolase
MVEQRERFRVAWVDTDTGGRIHFTAAFRWAEVTETSLYRRLGLLRGELADFPRRHVEADYHQVLVFEDEVEVRLWVDRVGTTSITYRWEVAKDDERAIDGTHTVVRVGSDGRPVALDDNVRALLEG